MERMEGRKEGRKEDRGGQTGSEGEKEKDRRRKHSIRTGQFQEGLNCVKLAYQSTCCGNLIRICLIHNNEPL